MSSYVPTDWVDGTTPLDEAHLDKIEQGIKAVSDILFSGGRLATVGILITDWNAATLNGWYRAAGSATNSPGPGVAAVGMTIADSPNYLIQIAYAHNDVTPPAARWWMRTRVGGTWGAWTLVTGGGGGGGLDWEGAWAGATPYVKGDVVTYQGVTYGAVNDSTGQTPPAASPIPQTFTPTALVTSLPATPFDGQEVILVDVIGAATYTWHLRYVAARATNKWIFLGGAPLYAETPGAETTTATAYGNLSGGTTGPSVVIPVAGDYLVEIGAALYGSTGGGAATMSYDIGGTGAVDADSCGFTAGGINSLSSVSRARKKALTAVTLTAKYKVAVAATGTFQHRWMQVTPIAVGG